MQLNNSIFSQSSSTNKLTRRSMVTGALLGWGYWSSTSFSSAGVRRFHSLNLQALDQGEPIFESRMIEHEKPLGFAHCASICESSDGRLICVWYAGSREGGRDVHVWLSELNRKAMNPNGESGGSWSNPQSIMDYKISQSAVQQYVKKVGNAIAFFDASDRLWLIYVSIAMGGWSTSSLNATYSEDYGQTWSASQRLWLSPTLNVSELVRCPPIYLTSGEIGVPIYHECAGVFPEMLWLDPTRSPLTYSKTRLCGGNDWLQPSVVPTGSQSAICYLRCANESRRVGYQRTTDGGGSWTQPARSELPNPNSAVCGVQLSDSSILLALNYSRDKRESLSLAYSADGVSNWQIVATMDQEPGERFSYPSIIRSCDGMIHLVYSWKMQKIRHLCFNDSWVYSKLRSRSIAERLAPILIKECSI